MSKSRRQAPKPEDKDGIASGTAMPETAKVLQKRFVVTYRLYVDATRHFVSELDRKDHVSWYDLLAATLLAGLSVEALANTT